MLVKTVRMFQHVSVLVVSVCDSLIKSGPESAREVAARSNLSHLTGNLQVETSVAWKERSATFFW